MSTPRSIAIARRLFVLTLTLAICGALATGPAAADVTVQVTTPSDAPQPGQCSLREAFAYAGGTPEPSCAANAPTGLVTITVPAGCYKLGAGALPLSGAGSNPVVIDGAGPGPAACTGTGTVINGRGAASVLDDGDGSPVTVNGVTITGGSGGAAGACGGAGCNGGGIDAFGPSLTLNDVSVTGNTAGSGSQGGNAPYGGDGGDGGGIYTLGGTVTVENSTVSGNSAGDGGLGTSTGSSGGIGGDGGGIYNDAGTVDIVDSTIAGNTAGRGGAATTTAGPGAGGNGGGIATSTGVSSHVSMTNVTLYGNAAGAGGAGGGTPGLGGGVFAGSGGKVLMAFVTAAGNQATQGSAIYASNASEYASIIANNGGTDPCDGPGGGPIDVGRDISYPSVSLCPGTVENPHLGQLQFNGGPVQTMALLAGSPAIDLVPFNSQCPATDARGVTRPQAFICDAGAYEWAPPALSNTSAGATSPTTAQVNVTVSPNLQATTVVVRYGKTTAYGSSTPAASAGSGNSPVAVSVPLGGLTPNTAYQAEVVATNPDGTTTSRNVSFTTPNFQPTGSNPPPAKPTVTGLRESARSWLLGTAAARVSASRHKVGTTFSFTLNEAATVNFTFSQTALGRKVSGRCVKPSKSNRRKPRCSRVSNSATLSFGGHAGANSVYFDGVIASHRSLKPGPYTVTVIAVNSVGRSHPSTLMFTIIKPPRKRR